MKDFFIKFKRKLKSQSTINKKKKNAKEFPIKPKSTQPKTTPIITVKDIQECNRRHFGQLSNNGVVEILSYSNRSQTDFFQQCRGQNIHDSNRFSFQTSSVYLHESQSPQQRDAKYIRIESNIFWQTINSLLRETESIYNEICLNSKNENDPFDNFSVQLENTIWEDKNSNSSLYSFFNPNLFKETDEMVTRDTNVISIYEYEYLNEILDLYIQEEEGKNKNPSNLEVPCSQISSGSTLILNK